MTFAIYLPPQAEKTSCPVLYWLSGLTCTEENFITKAGAQQYAAEHGLILVAPDTSPRGAGIQGEDDSWDLGTGAGFYVDAVNEPWSQHYRMASYISQELPSLICDHFPVMGDRSGIFGHSMGGHGALVTAFKNPGAYKSVSAFAPICSPTRCPWGEKAFTHYLGSDRKSWEKWDASLLIANLEERLPLLIDQGSADAFLEEQLKPELLSDAALDAGHPLELRIQDGYDHSYYFIASFIGDHIAHHARELNAD
jgi:S-formylglutathione hydrolase